MLDLDAKREERFGTDHSFKLLGQVYRVKRGIRPEAMLHWESMPDKLTGSEAIEELDAMVRRLLVEDDVAQWDEMRASDGDENVDMTDLQELVPALIGMATGRPFDNAASSGQASETPETGTPSTVTSDTKRARALTPSTSEAS